jgi:hypothetical protein
MMMPEMDVWKKLVKTSENSGVRNVIIAFLTARRRLFTSGRI